jgi:hypothetical protein
MLSSHEITLEPHPPLVDWVHECTEAKYKFSMRVGVWQQVQDKLERSIEERKVALLCREEQNKVEVKVCATSGFVTANSLSNIAGEPACSM